jgi:hypothetical protein
MDDDHLTQQYPAWREAITRLVRDHRLQPDALFEFAELYDLFLIKRPLPTTPLAEAEKLKLQFLAQFVEFEEALLTEHQVALTNVRGVGYRIVPPHEQTAWAERHGIGEVRKAVRKLSDRLTNVDFVALGAEDRKANADALARLGMLGGMLKQATEFKLLPPDKEEK